MKMRIEKDSLGEIEVPSHVLWGAQTQRSLNNFRYGVKMPPALIRELIIVKKAAARVNVSCGVLDKRKGEAIVGACDRVLEEEMRDEFPLSLYQTGSGTQTNMNVNEVLANLASQMTGETIHPNDHVNRSQSTNDVFPTAMALMTLHLTKELIGEIEKTGEVLDEQRERYGDQLKTGRTHCQDAVPITLGQEIGAWKNGLVRHIPHLEKGMEEVSKLPIGGTATGTGLNAPEGYRKLMVRELSRLSGLDLSDGEDLFVKLSLKGDLALLHGTVTAFAGDLLKIIDDIRLLASGPRCGLGEWELPANEPGSSIMPGKVNPTQIEALAMVCMRVFGNQTTIQTASSQGRFQLNAYMPIIAYAMYESLDLLTEGLGSLRLRCLEGMKPKFRQLKEYDEKNIMKVTALTPVIGYEKAAKIADYAYRNDLTLREAALQSDLMTEEEFDRIDFKESV